MKRAAAFRRHPVLFTLFAALLVVIAVLGYRVLDDARTWTARFDPDFRVAGWMTPRYIVRSFDVPMSVLTGALGERPNGYRRMTISQIAVENGKTAPELTDALEVAIQDWRMTNE